MHVTFLRMVLSHHVSLRSFSQYILFRIHMTVEFFSPTSDTYYRPCVFLGEIIYWAERDLIFFQVSYTILTLYHISSFWHPKIAHKYLSLTPFFFPKRISYSVICNGYKWFSFNLSSPMSRDQIHHLWFPCQQLNVVQ